MVTNSCRSSYGRSTCRGASDGGDSTLLRNDMGGEIGYHLGERQAQHRPGGEPDEAPRVHHACSAARRSRGRSRRARSRASGCGASACSWPQPQTIQGISGPPRRFSAGAADIRLVRSAATCGSDIRWAGINADDIRRHAAELVALAPDVILAHGISTVGPLQRTTRSVPIVFPVAGDPVGAGLVDSLARPGGNATGFLSTEYSLSGKWLELLKEIAPGLTRVAVLRDPTNSSGIAQFGVIQAMAPSLRVEVSPINVRDAVEIERAVTAFARPANGGLIATSSAATALHRDLIIGLAARHKLPAVYYERFFVAAGGLMSYGPDYVDQYRQAAGYVDRILKGEKPADLPVQAPNKYETGNQSQDCEGARPRSAADAARPRRRGDRVRALRRCGKARLDESGRAGTQTQHARLNSTRPQRVQMSFRRSALEPLSQGQNW